MKNIIAVALLAAGCGGPGIEPEPTGGSSANAITSGGASADGGANAQGGASNEGGGVPGGGYESGARLKARSLVGADGSRSHLEWFDSEKTTVCSWARTPDGTHRCLPVVPYISYYFDSGCSQPLATQAACGSTTYVRAQLNDCDATTKLFQVGGPTAPGANVFVRNGTSCTAVTAPNLSFFSTTEADLNQWVASTVETEP